MSLPDQAARSPSRVPEPAMDTPVSTHGDTSKDPVRLKDLVSSGNNLIDFAVDFMNNVATTKTYKQYQTEVYRGLPEFSETRSLPPPSSFKVSLLMKRLN
jgi:hypothetical protein